jgi:hypothetical protein
MYDIAASHVVSGFEDEKGDIYVKVLLGESGYINNNNVGFTPEILAKWHREGSWQGKVQNVHPSGNHPLAYEPKIPHTAPIPEQLDHYTRLSNKYGFGTFVNTELKAKPDGNNALYGIFRMVDEGAKQAWREGKYPKYSSSSVLIVAENEKGLTTAGYPIASTCVKMPAFPVDVAEIKNHCTGGPECVTKLAESGCFCKHEVLTNFGNNFSSQEAKGLFENSMVDDTKPKDSSSETEQPTDPLKQTQTQTSADGTTTTQVTSEKVEDEVDWKSKFAELDKEHKKILKAKEDYESETNRKFDKIFKEKLEGSIRAKLEKVPLFAFDNKEDNRDKEVDKFMKFYPKLSEDEILNIAEEKYKLAPQLVAVANKKGKVGESGITNDGRLITEDSGSHGDIRKAHEVFG